MNTTVITDEVNQSTQENPGFQLARIREKMGFTREYVAGKLHLRVKVIELLEADDYQQMPEPVFIKGYLRAYAKLLGVAPEPYVLIFNNQHSLERRPEKALWQSRRESNKGELVVRWVTGFVAIAAIIAVGFWWQKYKEQQPYFSFKSKELLAPLAETKSLSQSQSDSNAQLTDISKMQSMFSSKLEENTAVTKGG